MNGLRIFDGHFGLIVKNHEAQGGGGWGQVNLLGSGRGIPSSHPTPSP